MIALVTVLALAGAVRAHDAHTHGHGGHETAIYGVPGDPAKPAREIEVTMSEAPGRMLFTPALIEVRKGEQIRFKVRNPGALAHELVIGTQDELDAHADMMLAMPDMQHDEPNGIRLASQASGDLLWQFTNAGEFPFACLIPGHREAGMVGKVVVR
jgi:uncharacterized cupredoxin-like copper-binding protein